jgi:hypothetical protein
MKVRYEEDPYSWPQIVGKPGNAISGAYATMPYPSYTPHRDGAAGDEITCTAIDGICEYTWENTQHIPFNPVVGDISIQWTSSANNGTLDTVDFLCQQRHRGYGSLGRHAVQDGGVLRRIHEDRPYRGR